MRDDCLRGAACATPRRSLFEAELQRRDELAPIALSHLAHGQEESCLDPDRIMNDDADDAGVIRRLRISAVPDEGAIHGTDEHAEAAVEKSVMRPAEREPRALAERLRQRVDALRQQFAEYDKLQYERQILVGHAVSLDRDVGCVRGEEEMREAFSRQLSETDWKSTVRVAELLEILVEQRPFEVGDPWRER
jgi:hypothetical protein